MSRYRFPDITKVDTADGYINSTLSKTQRHTPTVIRRHYAISRIRKFYLTKVRYTTKLCDEKFSRILEEFPEFDKLHPFYRELFNLTYAKDHYKVALGQINALKSQVQKVGADYTKLLKYGDSLYRCKQLKKAALGRMVTMMRKQKNTFVFLEDIRQHISRLPCIDPTTQSVILTGCPNVGKSSFMDLVSRTKPEIQAYPNTTKSLYVGHFDYEHIRWQVLDTPGLGDSLIEEKNQIEMNTITALGQIECAVVFFLDVSETCDHTVAQQLKVFNSIRPLFNKRPFALACNKSDLKTLAQLAEEEPEKRALIAELEAEGVPIMELSTRTKVGVQEVMDRVCRTMLTYSVNERLKSKRVEHVLNRVYVAKPVSDGKERPKFIPEAVLKRHAQKEFFPKMKESEPEAQLEADIEASEGDFYTTDYCKNKLLENPEWNYDKIPLIMNGKNVADFYSPDITERLEQLEMDEKAREEAGFYDTDPEDEYTPQEEELIRAADKITEKMTIDKINKSLDTGKGVRTINRASRPRTRDRSAGRLTNLMEKHGVEISEGAKESFNQRREKRARSESAGPCAPSKKVRQENHEVRLRSRSTPRGEAGMPDPAARKKVEKQAKKAFKAQQNKGMSHPSDRGITDWKPKHLYCGKRGIGKNNRR